MKRRLFILVALLGLFIPVGSAQRLLKGQTGITLLGGTPFSRDHFNQQGDIAGSVLFSRYMNHTNYWVIGLSSVREMYPYKDAYLVPVMDYIAGVGYMHPVVSDPWKNFIVYLGGRALGGYEEVNGGVPNLPNGVKLLDRSAFVYGCALSGSFEFVAGDNLILLSQCDGNFLWGSDLNLFRGVFYLGLKYNF